MSLFHSGSLEEVREVLLINLKEAREKAARASVQADEIEHTLAILDRAIEARDRAEA
jgi:hypothetical protein